MVSRVLSSPQPRVQPWLHPAFHSLSPSLTQDPSRGDIQERRAGRGADRWWFFGSFWDPRELRGGRDEEGAGAVQQSGEQQQQQQQSGVSLSPHPGDVTRGCSTRG